MLTNELTVGVVNVNVIETDKSQLSVFLDCSGVHGSLLTV
ncbi:hypothetical protein M595_1902 [Lyngbya aestuarii BL J]|uniref:Uncharacterized protein n=1 Tax=Lyngbya aestuarii BL J TaxID=1348334 RepID=U7QJQ1_9CYAN|nr:hypothetical protein M595_1902 [Lyngbya aestuarii BL J]